MPITLTERDGILADVAAALEQYLEPARAGGVSAAPASLGGYAVTAVQQLPDGFEHRWPNRTTPTQYRATGQVPTASYTVRTAEGDYDLTIGPEREGRRSHGRADRGRIVVFAQRGGSHDGTNLYPLVEFAEADIAGPDGLPLYAAGIPRIGAPRSLATDGDLEALRQVPHLSQADIRRADDVYESMQTGPTLRLVVAVTNVDSMLLHALWVGGLRGGGRLPRPA